MIDPGNRAAKDLLGRLIIGDFNPYRPKMIRNLRKTSCKSKKVSD
jgi:hypothetical protein